MMESHQAPELFIITIVGDEETGKTSLARRLTDKPFETSYSPTFCVDAHSTKKLTGTKTITLGIWDTSSEERFHHIADLYLKQAKVIILTYDITRKETFENLSNRLAKIKEIRPNTPIILVGCKSDLDAQRQISAEQAESFANENRLIWFGETSAKTGENVEALFHRCVSSKQEKKEEKHRVTDNELLIQLARVVFNITVPGEYHFDSFISQLTPREDSPSISQTLRNCLRIAQHYTAGKPPAAQREEIAATARTARLLGFSLAAGDEEDHWHHAIRQLINCDFPVLDNSPETLPHQPTTKTTLTLISKIRQLREDFIHDSRALTKSKIKLDKIQGLLFLALAHFIGISLQKACEYLETHSNHEKILTALTDGKTSKTIGKLMGLPSYKSHRTFRRGRSPSTLFHPWTHHDGGQFGRETDSQARHVNTGSQSQTRPAAYAATV